MSNLKPLMDELALLFVKIVETAVFEAVNEGRQTTPTTADEPKNNLLLEKSEPQGEVLEEGRKRKKHTRRVFPKPCPECGVENVRRRYSYLCEAHTTEEHLAKHRGWTKTAGQTDSETEAEVAA
jgi:hypothetical protein